MKLLRKLRVLLAYLGPPALIALLCYYFIVLAKLNPLASYTVVACNTEQVNFTARPEVHRIEVEGYLVSNHSDRSPFKVSLADDRCIDKAKREMLTSTTHHLVCFQSTADRSLYLEDPSPIVVQGVVALGTALVLVMLVGGFPIFCSTWARIPADTATRQTLQGIRWILGTAMMAIFVMVMNDRIVRDIAANRSKDWEPSSCTLMNACREGESGVTHAMYEHHAAGMPVLSTAVGPFSTPISEKNAQSLVQYQPGMELPCFFNPKTPAQSKLVVSEPFSLRPYLLAVLATVIGLLIAAWIPMKR